MRLAVLLSTTLLFSATVSPLDGATSHGSTSSMTQSNGFSTFPYFARNTLDADKIAGPSAQVREHGDNDHDHERRHLKEIDSPFDITVVDQGGIDRRIMSREDLLQVLSEKQEQSVDGRNRNRDRRRLIKGSRKVLRDAVDFNDGNLAEENLGNFRGTNHQRRTEHKKASSKSSKKSKSKKGGGSKNQDPQIVYLFFPGNPAFNMYYYGYRTFPAYNYTQSDRDEIQERLEKMYVGYNIVFTQSEPTDTDEYTTLTFECAYYNCMSISQFGGSILFGAAENIDFHNLDHNDTAFIQAEFWQFLKLIDPTDVNLNYYSDALGTTSDRDEAYTKVIIRQASRTAAHELGHLLGLRHHDSFGPPSGGIAESVPPSAFYPTFDGLSEGDETFLHIMASGASVGLPFYYEVDRDDFFSERSMVKLLSNEDGEFLNESDVGGLHKKLEFNKLKTGIAIPEGDNAGLELEIHELLISGRINATGETDFFRFDGKAGDIISAEFNGFDIFPQWEYDVVIGALNLYRENEDGTWTLVASNHQNFEGFDAFLIDAKLETDSTYIMEVFAPDVVYFGFDYYISLDLAGYEDFRVGDYFLSIYKIQGKP